jgi:hypothetical protein
MADRTHLLLMELHSFELWNNEPLLSFFARLLDLWTRLAAANVPHITTGHMIQVVVHACVHKYENACNQIRATPNCTMDMARSMLTQWEELQIQKVSRGPSTKTWTPTGVVNAMSAHVQVDGPSEAHGGPPVAQGVTMEQVMEMMQAMMSGPNASKYGGGGGGMGGAPTPTCYNCGRKGHLRNECKKARVGDGFTYSPKHPKRRDN